MRLQLVDEMLERLCLLQHITQNNQHKRRGIRRARAALPLSPTNALPVKRASSLTDATGLRLVLLLLCLCAFGISSCGQTTGAVPIQGAQQQNQNSVQTYVAIGASDTFGIGSRDPYTENWPADLVILLKQPIHLLNLGIPGITLHDALTGELPIALDAHPTLVTVWLAVNDLAANVPVDSYRRDLDALLSRLQAAAPQARIAVGNMPDLTSVPFFSKENPVTLNQQIAVYNIAIDSVVQSHRAILVDLSGQGYNLQEHPEYISDDGLHPSDLGYFQLAQLFYDALRKA